MGIATNISGIKSELQALIKVEPLTLLARLRIQEE